MATNIHGHFVKDTSSWRKIAANAWRKPDDPSTYGRIEVPARRALAWMEEINRTSESKVTVTHLMVKVAAETLRRHPDCNGYIRRGRIFVRDDVDISVLAAAPPEKKDEEMGADLTEIVIRKADQKSIQEIAMAVVKDAHKIRTHHDPFLETAKHRFQLMPPLMLKLLLRLSAVLQYDWNVDLKPVGVPHDTFGSVMITSLGMMGINEAYAPIPPFSRIPLLLAVGVIEEQPIAVKGRVAVEPVLPINATIDHRLIDGFQAARLSNTMKELLGDPAAAFGTPPRVIPQIPAERQTDQRDDVRRRRTH